jgi:hypothetical protein
MEMVKKMKARIPPGVGLAVAPYSKKIQYSFRDAEYMVNVTAVAAICVLHGEFGFGAERIRKYLTAYQSFFDDIGDDTEKIKILAQEISDKFNVTLPDALK